MADAAVSLEMVQVSAVAGAALPIVAAIFKQDRLSRRANTIIAAALALGTALVVAWARHEFDPENILPAFTATYTTAVAFYHGLWKPTGVAPTVQRRTSARPKAPRRP